MSDWLLGIFEGIIISVVVYFIVTFIPIKENARYKAIFYRRKISKFFSNPRIEVCYTTKTGDLEDKNIRLDDFVSKIKEKMTQSNFAYQSDRGNASVFDYTLADTDVEIVLTPSYVVKGDEEEGELIVDHLQCDFRLKECRYRNFKDHFLNLIQIFRKLEMSLEEEVGRWIGESLTCEVKRLYDFVGVLKDLRMSSLTGTMADRYKIELSKNRLVVYGTIETKMTSMVKDIITYYF